MCSMNFGAAKVIKDVKSSAVNLYKEQGQRPDRNLPSDRRRGSFRRWHLENQESYWEKRKRSGLFFQQKNWGSSGEAIEGGLKVLGKAVSGDSPWVGDLWSCFARGAASRWIPGGSWASHGTKILKGFWRQRCSSWLSESPGLGMVQHSGSTGKLPSGLFWTGQHEKCNPEWSCFPMTIQIHIWCVIWGPL